MPRPLRTAPVTAPLFILVLAAAGCRNSNGDRTRPPVDDRLEGVEWQLVRIEAPEATVTRDELVRAVTLEFRPDDHEREDGARLATGHAPCNSFSAAYRSESEGDVSFEEVVSTRMACPDEVMLHEGLLFDALENATTYEIDGSRLRIISDTVTLTYEAN